MGLINLFVRATPKPIARDRVVGIDIGSSSIKVVELEERDGVVTLTTYGELQLGPYTEGGVVGQVATLLPPVERQALVDILRESAVKAKRAVLAIPLSASFVTTMSMQAGAEDDISSRVRVDARKYIPVPIADVTLDWAEISVNSETEGVRDVLLAAIQNDALKRFMTLMQTVELPAPPTEIECFSTIRSAFQSEKPHSAVIDIGASVAKLYLIENGLLARMHRVPTGSIKVTERLMQERQLSFVDAEQLKRTVTPQTADYGLVQKITHVTYTRVLKEFRQVIDEYELRSGHTISDIVLSGGGVVGFGLDAAIAQEFARATTLIQPFDKVAYPAFMEDTLREIGPVFAPALGAALRQFE
jgi:type IV pilus assembly protein PilM